MLLDHKQFRNTFNYNPHTGEFEYNVHFSTYKIGDNPVRHIMGEYVVSYYDRKKQALITLTTIQAAWFYYHGFIPSDNNGVIVKPINGDKYDVRINNLELVVTNKSYQDHNNFATIHVDHIYKTYLAYAHMYNYEIELGEYSYILEAALAVLTWEIQCPFHNYNGYDNLVKLIKSVWPGFVTPKP